MIRIDLHQGEGDEERLFLFVEKPGLGISYTTQTDGTSCAHMEAEGYLVPLHEHGDNHSLGGKLCEFFQEPQGDELIRKLAALVSFITYSIPDHETCWGYAQRRLKLDVERLKQSGRPPMEAWLPVLAPPYGKGWLTWGNSD